MFSSDFELKAELDLIKDFLIGNGYPQKFIDKFISGRKIRGKTKSSAPNIKEDEPFCHYLILRVLLTF